MLDEFVRRALSEDLGDGDHTSLACINEHEKSAARLEVRERGILAGIGVAKRVFELYDSSLEIEILKNDGDSVIEGDIAFIVKGSARSILSTERLVLNLMQRMSGIATKTHQMLEMISHTDAILLDTRKTTPGMRFIEKEAVAIGGGGNHRFGLYDMIMIKDNHIDYAGGISRAIQKTHSYLDANNKKLKIEVEVRSLNELDEVLTEGKVHRIMLDNFSPKEIENALKRIPQEYETEASGNVTLKNVKAIASTGINRISVGSITHSAPAIDFKLEI